MKKVSDEGVVFEQRPDGNVRVEVYPPADKQEASNRKYVAYDTVQTGAAGKPAPRQ